MSPIRMALCLSIVSLGLLPSLTTARGADSIVARLPADSCFVLWTNDFAELAAAFARTNLGQLATGQEFRPLVTELAKRDRPAPLHLRPWFGFDWADVANVKGPGALVVFPLEKGKRGAAWLLDASNSSDAKTACLAQGERYFLAKEFRKSTVKVEHGELTLYDPPPGAKGEATRVHFTSGSFFGAADSRAAAEALLATKPAKSLQEDALFAKSTEVDRASLNAGSAGIFMRPWELWSLERAQQIATKPKARDPFVMSERQGLPGIKAIGGTIQCSDNHLGDIAFSLDLVVESPYKKALGMLALQAGKELAPPEWLPADVTSVVSWRWNFSSAMKAFGNLFDELSEPGPIGDGLFEELLDGLSTDPDGPLVDLRKELFARLGPEILEVTDRRGKPPHEQRVHYVIAAKETPAIAAALVKFYAGDKQVTHTKPGGVDVWTVDEGNSLFVAGENSTMMQPRAMAVTADRVLLSTDNALLESALSGKVPADTLATSAEWKRLRSWQKEVDSPSTALRGFVRTNQAIEPAYRQLKTGKAVASESLLVSTLRLLLLGSAQHHADLPYRALPDVAAISPHLRPLGISMSQTKVGWQLRGAAVDGLNEDKAAAP